MRSKTFDNATSCSSENSVVIEAAVYQPMLAALAAQGCVLLSGDERRNCKPPCSRRASSATSPRRQPATSRWRPALRVPPTPAC